MANYTLVAGIVYLVLRVDGKVKSKTIQPSDKFYDKVVEAIKLDKSDEELLTLINAEESKLTTAVKLDSRFDLKQGKLFYNGMELPTFIGQKITEMMDQGFNIKPMVAFLNNLMNNPSKRVFENLYEFLEKGRLPLTEDGCFLVYRAVANDFYDIHSHTVLNKPAALMTADEIAEVVSQTWGKRNEATIAIEDGYTTISMPRMMVNENPDQTCSDGFHVASYDYLKHFAASNGYILVCKVNPANVVAIPADYNATKMRVSKYQITDVYEGPSEDSLPSAAVRSSSPLSNKDLTFLITGIYADGTESELNSFDSLVEAASALEDDYEDFQTPYVEVRLTNTKTDSVIDSRELIPMDSDQFEGDGDLLTFSVVDSKGNVVDDDFESYQDALLAGMEASEDGLSVTIMDSNGYVRATLNS